MAKSIKIPNDNYLDSTSIVHNKEPLNRVLVDTYSTEEVKTNKVWIDGKPIYRKVFKGTSTTQRGVSISFSGLNLETLTHVEGFLYSIYNQWWSIHNYYGHSTEYWTSWNSNGTSLGVDTGIYFNYPPYIIILEYTKTTD